MTTQSAPTAPFLAMMLASNWQLGSSESGYSTLISLSSAGAILVAPPQTITPPTFSVIDFISSALNATGASISIRSAVPPAPVMARLLVFGISSPAAATIGTMSSEILFPGTPPILCLSMMGWVSNSSFSPVSIIALVSHSVCSAGRQFMWEAVINAVISMSLRFSFTISFTRS